MPDFVFVNRVRGSCPWEESLEGLLPPAILIDASGRRTVAPMLLSFSSIRQDQLVQIGGDAESPTRERLETRTYGR